MVVVFSSEEFPTNVDWQDFLKHANQLTAVKYEQVIVEYALYCSTNEKVLTCPLSVKMFLSHCHNTPKICKRDNKRYEHVVGQMYPQLTAELQQGYIYKIRRILNWTKVILRFMKIGVL